MNSIERIVQTRHVLEVPITTFSAGVLHYWVTSEEETDCLILDAAGREAYRARQPYMPLIDLKNEKMHVGEMQLPHEGQWFIIVRNISERAIQVQVSFDFESSLHKWAKYYRG